MFPEFGLLKGAPRRYAEAGYNGYSINVDAIEPF